MSVEMILLVLHGALMAATATCGLFFLRFWRESQDRLFLVFALAFWVLSVNWLVIVMGQGELHSVVPYSVRLAAFVLILLGILDKNLSPRRGSGGTPG